MGLAIAALLLAAGCAGEARAWDLTDDLTINGYLDLRAVAPSEPQSWLHGGLGKYRYGGMQIFGTEGVLQADAGLSRLGLEDVHLVSVLRADPDTPSVVDALETYLRYDRMAGDLTTQREMLAEFVTPDYRALVGGRFLTYPLVAMFTMLVCFWSVEISLVLYLLPLPLYMIPGRRNPRETPESLPSTLETRG